MTQAKLTSVQGDGTWQGKQDLMYAFMVTVVDESGKELIGRVNAKSSNPPWMEHNGTDKPVWFEVVGEYKEVAKLKLTTKDPSEGGYTQGKQYTRGKENPETIKRIENSWAITTAVQIFGPASNFSEDIDTYLKYVYELAPRLKAMRDKLG